MSTYAYENILDGIIRRARTDAQRSLENNTFPDNPYSRWDYRELWCKEFNLHRVKITALEVGIGDLTQTKSLIGKRVRTLEPMINMERGLNGLPCEDPAGMEGVIERQGDKLIVRFDDGITWADYSMFMYEFVIEAINEQN